jgi:hypothetical protein
LWDADASRVVHAVRFDYTKFAENEYRGAA